MRAAMKIPAGRNQADNLWRDDNILGGIDIEEILKNFGGRQRGPSARPRPAPTRGADIEQEDTATRARFTILNDR